ncbi:hypothetical protein TMP248_140047 [Tenacibaculum maritimum]|nr:hypothetical protein TMP248_140047 [Tenacibaculum maritimum]
MPQNNLLNILLENYGKKILRKNSKDRLVETKINDTYLELILEFPEDYSLNVSQLV